MNLQGSTEKITVSTIVNCNRDKAWRIWNDPFAIREWHTASPDWHTPRAVNNLKEGQTFSYRMESLDGTNGFDMEGQYTRIVQRNLIEYTMADGRQVSIAFEEKDGKTYITEIFDPENVNPAELQRQGWQNILDNYKARAEKETELCPLHYEILIGVRPALVYRTMTDSKQFRVWASAFCEGSYFEGSWQKDAEIRFLATNERGEKAGMIGRVIENIINEYILIRYSRSFDESKEHDSSSERWNGAKEIYRFQSKGEKTLLKVDLTVLPEYKNFFNKTWPAALEKIKELSELAV